jgi:hypothetical protein
LDFHAVGCGVGIILSSCSIFPIHQFRLGGRSIHFTLDIFNPLNEEARYPFYDPSKEYISLIPCQEEFVGDVWGIKNPAQAEAAWTFAEEYSSKIAEAYSILDATFAFGAGTMAYNLAVAANYARKPLPSGLDFSDFFWPYAIYSPAIKRKVRTDQLNELDRFPRTEIGLKLESLPAGELLVYTPFLFGGSEDGLYARVLGLRSILSIRVKDMPL